MLVVMYSDKLSTLSHSKTNLVKFLPLSFSFYLSVFLLTTFYLFSFHPEIYVFRFIYLHACALTLGLHNAYAQCQYINTVIHKMIKESGDMGLTR